MHPLPESGFGQSQLFEKRRRKWRDHAEIFTGRVQKRKPPRDPLK
jgi:hypothetical protein